jgi:CIC family chloride channel protein
MRSPFTGIVFALELTHDMNMLLPLVVSVFVAHGFTVLTLRRSILTEKVARRGYHLSREYAVDPLEVLTVAEVMRTNIAALPADTAISNLGPVTRDAPKRGQHLIPVLDKEGLMVGVVTRKDLHSFLETQPLAQLLDGQDRKLADVVKSNPVLAYADEPLRAVVYRMAETSLTRFPVVERGSPREIVGMVSLNDLLKARERNLEEERQRERVLNVRFSGRQAQQTGG